MTHQWNERAVELRVVKLRTLLWIEAQAKLHPDDPMYAPWLTLVQSCHYADDGSPVFANVDAVLDVDAPLAGLLMALAQEAVSINSPKPVPNAGGDVAQPAPNGAAAAPQPNGQDGAASIHPT